MSLNDFLNKSIVESISKFSEKIAEKYGLDSAEILALWDSNVKAPSKSKKGAKSEASESNVDMSDLSPERLYKCSKAELTALCKSHDKKCTGTKEVLISRLLGKDEEDTPKKKGKKVEKEEKSVNKKSPVKKGTTASVLKKLAENSQSIPIRKNKFGNFIHPETNFVFNDKSKKVVGKQEDDGKISDLTEEDIETCKKYKFMYDIPENLDSKDDIKKVKIDELDDESDIEIDEEEVIVESDAEEEEDDEEEEPEDD